jgi:tetratricopeptide (TPR) repeat protein
MFESCHLVESSSSICHIYSNDEPGASRKLSRQRLDCITQSLRNRINQAKCPSRRRRSPKDFHDMLRQKQNQHGNCHGRLHGASLLTSQELCRDGNICRSGNMQLFHYCTINLNRDDFEFCKERLSNKKDGDKIDALWNANQLCDEALTEGNFTARKAKAMKALEISPDHCAHAYMILFEMEYVTVRNANAKVGFSKSNPSWKAPLELCQKAVNAGRAFVKLIDTDSFCRGNLHSFVPGRWYVRSLYTLGSYLLFIGEYKKANEVLKEALANDTSDTLGARHKQLLAILLGKNGINDEAIGSTLKSKFGEDQLMDEYFALWTYTRALHAFVTKGNCSKSKKLLIKAIDMNPYAAALILNWELSMEGEVLMKLGSLIEATEYVSDTTGRGRKTWQQVDGALDWLEKAYCQHPKASVPPISRECSQWLSKGTAIFEACKGGSSQERKAIDYFQKVLNNIESPPSTISTSPSPIRCMVHRRIGLCYSFLKEKDAALRHMNSALCYCEPTDKDMIKELYFNRASVKEDQGDLTGALRDFQFVFERIERTTTGHQGITRIEGKLKNKSSLLPPRPNIGVHEDAAKMDNIGKKMEKLLPNRGSWNDTSKVATMDRCSHCDRGGVKLFHCAGCKDVHYCSKPCQKNAWKSMHKYLCKTSKHYLINGEPVRICGLAKAQRHNGKIGTIVKAKSGSDRFIVDVPGEEDSSLQTQMSIKPQSLEKMLGTCVQICGLGKAPHHNEKIGTIEEYSQDLKRFVIKL